MDKIITKDIYEIVTQLIIQKLEQGVVPWKQPWKGPGLPRNLVTGRPYRGVNLMLLSYLGYSSNEFLTFKQVQELGGRVNKGEKAHLVVLWLWVEEPDVRSMNEVKAKKKPLLRYYFVFNVAQCSGLPKRAGQLPQPNECSVQEKCEAILTNMPDCPKILHNEPEAYYHSLADYINMPKWGFFASMDGYWSVLFHELIHSTGASHRLNRKELVDSTRFASEEYSIEELTAQIGCCYLCSYTGIKQSEFDNNVAYIQGWLKRLKEDKRFIIYASAQAQKAVDYILNVKHEDNEITNDITVTDGN